jgi:DNA-binding LytR/AlgR family response regulator
LNCFEPQKTSNLKHLYPSLTVFITFLAIFFEMPTTLLIADDEEAPREQLRAALKKHWPEAKIVAATEHGVDAWDSFLEHEPQACFLDIQMPGLTGIEVAQRIAQTQLPCAIVFCTAYNDHAVKAFDAGAVDYVLKPLDDTRFAQAVQRVQGRIAKPADSQLPAEVLALLGATKSAHKPLRSLQASIGKEVRLIRVDDVIYFESDQRYTKVIYTQGGADAEALIRTPLKELLAGLDAERFWQVHRSVIVNTDHIASAVRVDESNMHIVLRGRGETLPVSRAFQGLFRGQ